MTDKYGPKPVLAIGFIAAIVVSLIVIFFSSQNPDRVNVFASLFFIGLGIEGMSDLNEMRTVKFDMSDMDSADMNIEIPDE